VKEDLEAVVDEPNGDGVAPNALGGADENVEEPKAAAVDVAGGAPKADVVEEAPPKLGTIDDDVPKGVEALAVPPKEDEGAAEGVWAKDEEVEDVREAPPPNCVPKPGGCVADDAGGAPNADATVGPPKTLADAEAGAAPPKAPGAEAPNGVEDAG
jgi:hypothetical protein